MGHFLMCMHARGGWDAHVHVQYIVMQILEGLGADLYRSILDDCTRRDERAAGGVAGIHMKPAFSADVAITV